MLSSKTKIHRVELSHRDAELHANLHFIQGVRRQVRLVCVGLFVDHVKSTANTIIGPVGVFETEPKSTIDFTVVEAEREAVARTKEVLLHQLRIEDDALGSAKSEAQLTGYLKAALQQRR